MFIRSLRCLVPWITLAWAGLAQAAPAPLPALADCDAPTPAQVLASAAPIDAAAHWVSRRLIRWPGVSPAVDARYWLVHATRDDVQVPVGARVGELRGSAGRIALTVSATALPPALLQRFRYLADGVQLQLPAAVTARLPALLQQALLLVEADAAGRVRRATALQTAGVIDELYAPAARLSDLGAHIVQGRTRFSLWAPTSQHAAVCLHASGTGPAQRLLPLQRDARTGAWSATVAGDLTGRYYTYLVDVHARSTGLMRNRVTDPYSLSLTTDSRRSWIGNLDASALQPEGWSTTPRPDTVKAATDLVIYELHVRDFSAADTSLPETHRGKYLAFTHADSAGMRHLKLLADAGVTDVHLLPVFDFASVPERGCATPDAARLAAAAADSEEQQTAVAATAATDCFNWGYDPLHFTAPEGSYATHAADGAVRVREFRRMVQALHRAGLRVGMDMVYNHTSASGQDTRSVLDRIVPGYYQRLNALGAVESSTCCANTATENAMMAKLMVDSAVVWARDYGIDSMRFDLMGHQPRAAMAQLQLAVDRATGRHIHLIGEGWNFGEVANGARFVQAAQRSLNDSGIGSFSDRGRDAVRGGGCCDGPAEVLQRQGWINGLHYSRNPQATAAGVGSREELLRTADLVRVGLAGTLQGYRMTTHDGTVKSLADIDYAGQGAGFASQPDEVVNYVENHDNPTLFDINVLKLPPGTGREDRARVQVLGGAITAFSQGIAYFHAGIELLRSKSLDRNSYDSGDWFNRLDWTAQDNHFGSGLPPRAENAALWPAMKPLLADAGIKPAPADIAFTRNAFLDLLRVRASSTLFRLRTADEVAARLRLLNTGPAQVATVVAGHLDGRGLPGARFAELLYAINVDTAEATLELPELKGRAFVLHPVHRGPGAADARPAALSRWDAINGTLHVPARTALVYVLE